MVGLTGYTTITTTDTDQIEVGMEAAGQQALQAGQAGPLDVKICRAGGVWEIESSGELSLCLSLSLSLSPTNIAQTKMKQHELCYGEKDTPTQVWQDVTTTAILLSLPPRFSRMYIYEWLSKKVPFGMMLVVIPIFNFPFSSSLINFPLSRRCTYELWSIDLSHTHIHESLLPLRLVEKKTIRNLIAIAIAITITITTATD
jgi:hypothetical protein